MPFPHATRTPIDRSTRSGLSVALLLITVFAVAPGCYETVPRAEPAPLPVPELREWHDIYKIEVEPTGRVITKVGRYGVEIEGGERTTWIYDTTGKPRGFIVGDNEVFVFTERRNELRRVERSHESIGIWSFETALERVLGFDPTVVLETRKVTEPAPSSSLTGN